MARNISASKKLAKIAACSNKKKWKNSCMAFLHEEIIFNILTWLPAEVLLNVMRYVCQQWYNIIHDPLFITTHLHRAKAGLLIQNIRHPYSAHFVDVGGGDINSSKVKLRFPGKIMASHDGLLLFRDAKDDQILHVANPITKKWVTLPPFNVTYKIASLKCGLACIPSTKEYKVLLSCKDEKNNRHCLIVTVGINNAWRLVDTKHVCEAALLTLDFFPRSVGGFAIWAFHENPYVLTLDVEAEIIHQLSVPRSCESKICVYLVMGSFLSFITGHDSKLKMEVWVLTDFERGEWTKLYKIDLEDERLMLESTFYPNVELHPVAWLNHGELVIFRVPRRQRHFVAHNVKTGQTKFVEIDYDINRHIKRVHVESLVSW
uniref:F-box associated beta-propeller type 3 domain-containing protein n=1 Tax=Davidia involucrata TaxID=16924 RepID=A0A5B6YYW5_DAVIN